jgi:hypothetical protein
LHYAVACATRKNGRRLAGIIGHWVRFCEAPANDVLSAMAGMRRGADEGTEKEPET